MRFSQDYIVPELKARERFDAIREIVARLLQAGLLREEDQDALVAAFMEREKSMSTGIGSGVATPVARSNAVTEVVLAFGRSSAGVEWDSLDGQPVTFIVMFINPLPVDKVSGLASPVHENEYWRFKMHLIRSLQTIRDRLSRANSAEDLFPILKAVCDSA